MTEKKPQEPAVTIHYQETQMIILAIKKTRKKTKKKPPKKHQLIPVYLDIDQSIANLKKKEKDNPQ